MKNKNHPKKGSIITVEPIRQISDIDVIKNALKRNNPRDYLFFVLGINSGLRPSDLLSLRVGDIYNLKEGDTLYVTEGKTGNPNTIYVNKNIYLAIQFNFMGHSGLVHSDFVFKSRKGVNTPITISSINRMVKKWTLGISGNYGSMSLRKTWGYHQRVTYNVGYDVIAKRYGHSNPSVTMRYIGITPDEVLSCCKNEI